MGMGTWPDSRVVRTSASASDVFFDISADFIQTCLGMLWGPFAVICGQHEILKVRKRLISGNSMFSYTLILKKMFLGGLPDSVDRTELRRYVDMF